MGGAIGGMSKSCANLQDSFLNHVRREGKAVRIVLTNGGELEGIVEGFDNFTVIVRASADKHLVYKHAIAQLIAPRGAHIEIAESAPERKDREPRPAPKGGNLSPDGSRDNSSGGGKARGFNTLDLSRVTLAAASNSAREG